MPWLNCCDAAEQYYVALHPVATAFLKRRGWTCSEGLADAVGVDLDDLAYALSADIGEDGFDKDKLEIYRSLGMSIDDIIKLAEPYKPVLTIVRPRSRPIPKLTAL